MSKELREAGAAIAAGNMTDDVRRVSSERDLTNRAARRSADTDDRNDSGADERRVPTRGNRKRNDREQDRQPERKAKRRREDEDAEDRRPASRDDHSREADEQDDSDDQDNERRYSDEEDGADDDSNQPDTDEDGEDGEDQNRDDADDDDGEYDRQSDDEKRYEVKVEGKQVKVSLNDLKRGYLQQGDYQRKTQRLAARDKDLTEFHGKAAKDYQERVSNLGFVVGKLREMLVGDVNSPQMQALYAQDPTRWTTERTRMQDRIEKLNSVMNHLGSEAQRHQTATAQQHNDMLVRATQTEREMMHRHIPDWDDGADGRPAVKSLVGSFLREFGFSDQELAPIIDHRMLRIADMARRYLELKKRTDNPQRRAKPVPRRVRPQGGGQQTRQATHEKARQGGRQQTERLRTDLRKTGDMRTAGKLIERML